MTVEYDEVPVWSSLLTVQRWLQERLVGGTRCPCCQQYAKIYKRKLNSGMASALVDMYRYAGGLWFDVRKIDVRGGDYGKLVYWELIEPGKRVGMWRVTPKGVEFVRGDVRVPQFAEVYNGELRCLSGELVDIRQALGSKFDYEELMGARAAAGLTGKYQHDS